MSIFCFKMPCIEHVVILCVFWACKGNGKVLGITGTCTESYMPSLLKAWHHKEGKLEDKGEGTWNLKEKDLDDGWDEMD